MLGFMLRLFFILLWIVISPIVLGYSCAIGASKLPKWAYYFDNDEDGFDGSKLGWYDNYLGYDISKQSKLKRWWISYKWCVWRNPCFNLRYHPKISFDVTNPQRIDFTGNTFHHTKLWSKTKDPKAKLYYKMTANYDGERCSSWFYLIPLFKSYHLYLRFGLKVYPRHYFDEYWLDKISKEGFPESKKKGVYAITIRIRKE
ncbi:hypothetical protein PP586_gp07 [Pseudoalteromonas phage vB_PspS-H40/1]|uniref:hypothetical protein n=1 Tax=Pseudoalteromonas phage vB_PspS-H40/1 TaxID=1856120 RepID=UPI0007DD2261|nr:hypothetical protein PP586_gp07 [Pseudoalteromonas phage vB_PspS-H40/1]ANI22024.1 hypothetical protein H401_7 [Pseudoalteromonas phage vB_PspS-H40/1]